MRHWLSGLVWETGCQSAVDGDGTRASRAGEWFERLACAGKVTDGSWCHINSVHQTQ